MWCSRRVQAVSAADMANFQRLVFAMGEWDAGVEGVDPCALVEICTGQCRNVDGVAAQRSAVAAKMERCARVGPRMQNEIVTFARARYECRVSA